MLLVREDVNGGGREFERDDGKKKNADSEVEKGGNWVVEKRKRKSRVRRKRKKEIWEQGRRRRHK